MNNKTHIRETGFYQMSSPVKQLMFCWGNLLCNVFCCTVLIWSAARAHGCIKRKYLTEWRDEIRFQTVGASPGRYKCSNRYKRGNHLPCPSSPRYSVNHSLVHKLFSWRHFIDLPFVRPSRDLWDNHREFRIHELVWKDENVILKGFEKHFLHSYLLLYKKLSY